MNKLKKINLRSVIEDGDILPQNALKHILGGYNGLAGCNCSGPSSYCVTNLGTILVCCGVGMEECYNRVKMLITGGDNQSCGNCA